MRSIIKHNVITKAACELKASEFLKAMKNDDCSGRIKATTCTKGRNKMQCDRKAAQAMYGAHMSSKHDTEWLLDEPDSSSSVEADFSKGIQFHTYSEGGDAI